MYCSLQSVVCCWLLSEKQRLISNSVLSGTLAPENLCSRKSSKAPARRHSQNRKLTPVMLSLDTATTVFGEISKYVWNFMRNRWVRNIVAKTSGAWPAMPMLRKGNVKSWYNHQHDTIVITAFLLCHNTQQKDTQLLNVLCVRKTQQKVLNFLFLMTQPWLSSCFILPLVQNSVVRTL